MVTLEQDSLVFSFPEVHPRAELRIDFQRTLRIPDDNREYPLPPGMGLFPLLHVDDCAGKVPAAWLRQGGVLLPMYQAEALWIRFEADTYPFAIKVAAGKVNAVSGEPWQDALSNSPQDYVVAPRQPWLDGFSVDKNHVRQFVAMPLGAGYSAEEQLTGEARFGGLQILALPMKRERYEAIAREREAVDREWSMVPHVCCEMALAPGGLMRQSIYNDPHGISAWETAVHSRCYVHLVNSAQYASITGRYPPTEPISAEIYTDAGLPWFDYYAADREVLDGSVRLAGLDSVAATAIKKGEGPLPDNAHVTPSRVIVLSPTQSNAVRDGSW